MGNYQPSLGSDFRTEDDYYIYRYGLMKAMEADVTRLDDFCSIVTQHIETWLSEGDFYQYLHDQNLLTADDTATIFAIEKGYMKNVPIEIYTPYGEIEVDNVYVTWLGQIHIVEGIKNKEGRGLA